MKMFASSKEITNPTGRFGLVEGVFTPCVLTILGVIMFMRTGFVVGYGGLWLALAILGISKLITTLTALSLSAISTNTEVKGGGVYFMISRSLGPDFGGTIGITLYIAQAVGVSFYVIGFTEALVGVMGPLFNSFAFDGLSGADYLYSLYVPQIVSTLVIGGLFYLTFKGAEVALKVQNYVLGILLLSILSFLVGGLMDFDPVVFEAAKASSFSDGVGFWTAFAIFFPAATGITAGANMSGDLKNPERSIPWGTLLAIVFTLAIYIVQIILVAGSSSREALKATPFEALQTMSVFGPLIILGVFAATLSSALGSFLGAPRILQAMGRDGLMRPLAFFAKGVGPSHEPQRATVLTFIIASLVIWAGDLNAVAEIISMFFLIAYGTINLSAFVESRGGNPSFRPKFKFFHWTTALVGAIGCVFAMMKINDSYALMALSISAIIYFYLSKQDIKTNYGDAKRGYIFKKLKDSLRILQGTKADPKNWRPILLAVTQDISKDLQLIRVGSWIESNRGLYSILNIKEKNFESFSERLKLREEGLSQLEEVKKTEAIHAYSECLIVEDLNEGLFNFIQSYSIGALKTNTVLLQAPNSADDVQWNSFYRLVDIVASFNLNLAIYKPGSISLDKKNRTIDLWWRGEINGSLMALFSYLMTLNPSWSEANLRLLRAVSANEDQSAVLKNMEDLKRQSRIDAEVKVLVQTKDRHEIISTTSGTEADFVFLGMGAVNSGDARQSLESVRPLLVQLPSTLLVWSNGDANIFV